MNGKQCFVFLSVVLSIFLIMTSSPAWSQHWVSYEDNARYLALGDSLSAGYGAHPATNGFVYQLYQSGAIDGINNTLLCNLGIPNAISDSVLYYQVPQAGLFFSNTGLDYRKVVTLTIGGNDLFIKILYWGMPEVEVLDVFEDNLRSILFTLTDAFNDVEIYIGNQYDPQLDHPVLGPYGSYLAGKLNERIQMVVSDYSQWATVVDVHSAFEGKRGLLLIEKRGGDPFQVHPTNAGYRVMTREFAESIREANF